MKLLQVLEDITVKLNQVADNITNKGNNTLQVNNTNNGVSGLGNISTHANGEPIESMSGINTPIVESTCPYSLHIMTSGFYETSAHEYSEYITNWLVDTGIFKDVSMNYKVLNCGDSAESRILEVIWSKNSSQVGQIFCIVMCPRPVELVGLVKNVKEQLEDISITKTIIMGPHSYSAIDRANMRESGIELVGLEQMMSINDVIDMAYRKFPYKVLFETGFLALILDSIYFKYNGSSMMDSIKYNLDNVNSTLQTKADEISGNIITSDSPIQHEQLVESTANKLSLDKDIKSKISLEK